MADRRLIRASHLRSLLPAVLLLAPALAVATILVGAFTGRGAAGGRGRARRRRRPPRTATGPRPRREDDHDRLGRRHHARIAVRPARERRRVPVRERPGRRCARPTSWPATSRGRCRPAARRSAARARRTASPSRRRRRTRRALGGAGLDVVNLANNHAFDYGEAGRPRRSARSPRRRSPSPACRATCASSRAAACGSRSSASRPTAGRRRWTTRAGVRALIDQAAALADVVVVFFHAGAEGSDRTACPASAASGRSARTAATRARSPTSRSTRAPTSSSAPARTSSAAWRPTAGGSSRTRWATSPACTTSPRAGRCRCRAC